MPYPDVRWEREGDIPLPETASLRSGMLKIRDVTVEDAGVYKCIADNGVGSPVMKQVTLEVIGKCSLWDNHQGCKYKW